MFTAILLSFVMTFTVETKSSVKADGTFPSYDFDASYACTYQKGSVRTGDTATLNLYDLGGIQIDSIVLYLKSNKTAGSGIIRVQADGNQAAERNGSYKDWFGAYSTDYQPLTVLRDYPRSVKNLTIQVVGTVNSLHIEKYVITYQAAPAHSVSLMVGNELYNELTEERGGTGVLLPSLPDRDSLQFAGWSETEFGMVTELPSIHYPGERFYPTADVPLWSVWQYGEPIDMALVTELETGQYLYVNSQADLALKGIPQDGRMNIDVIDPSAPEQIYQITFLSPDTATIQHVQTGTFIGWQGKNMVAKESRWLVYHEGQETLFYTIISNETYVLWLNIMDSYGDVYAGLFKATPGHSPLGLRKPRSTDSEAWFTCHPEDPMDTEEVRFDGRERVVRIGIYELHIVDGKKYLVISNR